MLKKQSAGTCLGESEFMAVSDPSGLLQLWGIGGGFDGNGDLESD